MNRRIHIYLWLGALFVACQWLAPASMAPLRTAQASVPGITCTAITTSINFGNADPTAGLTYFRNFNSDVNLNTTGFLTYYCTNTSSAPQNIDVCISIGNPGGSSQRSMGGPKNGSLDYQLYKDAGNTQAWGSKYNTPGKWGTPYIGTVAVPANGTSAPITLPIYAAIDSSQGISWTTNKTGPYSATYGNGDVAFDTGPANTGCNNASGGGTISGFQVLANLVPTCQVATNPLDFGGLDGDPSNATATTTLTVSCVNETGYRVGLDNGKNWDGTTRRMRGGPTHSDYVPYQLYRGNCSTKWGNTDGTDTQTGTQPSQMFTVCGKIPPGQGSATPGDYFDAVTVYVYY
ncbi:MULTISPECIES: Csu type fimbrial protein [Rhodanobacter]|uniref:Spore coat protein n=1 Tax=Rhodanobacter thiooxydans TaxID=416169 RepID=A0A154QDF2_9GAMM|nr:MULTISPECIES: spore coat U domain-containing protein [Rhodanobacter]KZC20432.1 spore coat protein [Rhodanobacter denitrificans]KZC22237.1 spore coat protein [Rhodanobacter thiooxydans]UJJ51393.1 spore coat U domain-containing protein [Rhodanobacter denitrificans]UJM94140.1 spore coat U domain-containing protein [Rhodanobacter denitrificans]UJM97669.1 spore coat U domain-containing protein [Rhodanobacter denitrificans]